MDLPVPVSVSVSVNINKKISATGHVDGPEDGAGAGTGPVLSLQRVSQLVLIAAPARQDLQDILLFDETPDSFKRSLLANLGTIPKVFLRFLQENKGFPGIVTEMLTLGTQDQAIQQQWCSVYDERENSGNNSSNSGNSSGNKVDCGILCVTGGDDRAVRSALWGPLCDRTTNTPNTTVTTGTTTNTTTTTPNAPTNIPNTYNNGFVDVLYPTGDHFFIFDTEEVDIHIAHCILDYTLYSSGGGIDSGSGSVY